MIYDNKTRLHISETSIVYRNLLIYLKIILKKLMTYRYL